MLDSLGPVYYRVLPSRMKYTYSKCYKVQIWRWWLPFWISIYEGFTEEDAALYIKGHSTYYDCA